MAKKKMAAKKGRMPVKSDNRKKVEFLGLLVAILGLLLFGKDMLWLNFGSVILPALLIIVGLVIIIAEEFGS
jgi:hypothetical protein